MGSSLPLQLCYVRKSTAIINRWYTLIHSTALMALVYYRASFLFQNPENRAHTPTSPWLLVFAGELILSFIWLLGQAYRWRPVTRTLFPERLPEDKHLPAIDVFICTADPKREPTFGVMNTVISAMALDYPPERLHVYVSDDGGSSLTLYGMKEAWAFARSWLPFCRTHGIKTRCPEAYFSSAEDDEGADLRGTEFFEERKKIKKEFELFRERVMRATENGGIGDKSISGDHPPIIEVIGAEEAEMPILVYVSREKRPSHPHHFKAGALNVLLRVSSMISNSPYILVLDCDMYCNDPTSVRQAMCCHLDPKLSPSLAFVQFPQRFHNINSNDIYDSQMRSAFSTLWEGMDGLDGPVLSGTGFYMKRVALYGTSIQGDTSLTELRQTFGYSDEFIKSLSPKYLPNISNGGDSQVGVLYHSVSEDVVTGYTLHCKGWTSVFCVPSRPQFVGSSVTNLNDLLVQGTRWSSGLVDVGISKFCPFIYGPLKMSFLENICYSELSFFPFYFLPVWCFGTIPQLCLFHGIPLYPEVILAGGSIQTWSNEQRIWMIKSVTSHLYGSLDAIMRGLDINYSTCFHGDISRIEHGRLHGRSRQSNRMILRKDKGRIPYSVTLLSIVFAMVFLTLGSVVLLY
ncbi:Cellulose synthase-like protein G2 [Vitis vinifera]|uniref:Cellulose synthase-like protein G2 n=1 Tax=Vitis vinifera TaxID=29760 RepID=A0A438F772_VITVI|nr:Cellulose synthase-like protein G2 [Vitis vinifera]